MLLSHSHLARIQVPKFEFVSNARPSLFAYPPPPATPPKWETFAQVAITVLSTTAKVKARENLYLPSPFPSKHTQETQTSSLAHPAEGLLTAYIAAPSTAPICRFESASWWPTFTTTLLGILAAAAICFLNWKNVNILSDSQLCLVMQDDFTSSLNSDN
jgi:hypothetical protein